jgi:hypothetical protein
MDIHFLFPKKSIQTHDRIVIVFSRNFDDREELR